jgi:uncharacterized protein with ParB-like and HNH nuclease domain
MSEILEKIENDVLLKTESLETLLDINQKHDLSNDLKSYNLSIPDYQRIYCWEEKQVIKLLEDLLSCTNREFHLGNIILHKIKGEHEHRIVDGQQRLVTLSLLLLCLDSSIETPLLNQAFQSDEAQHHIAYNKFLIKDFCAKNSVIKSRVNDILINVKLSVLVINDGNLDLAYTFFSNQNSRGKALSDFDLLKAHHLRYILIPEQAEHLAGRWDDIILISNQDESLNILDKLFGTYLFRLRKWMRKREWSNDAKFKIKNEFEAASIIPDIPAFGEQFNFNESIQGGTHFFAYSDHFIFKFKTFSETQEYKSLNKYLCYENHGWYKDIIESFLFAYFLKFGTIYLAEALEGIGAVVSHHRYENNRAYLRTLLRFASDTEIIMMVDQATSPTFFLAEIRNKIKSQRQSNPLAGTRQRYYQAFLRINEELALTNSKFMKS